MHPFIHSFTFLLPTLFSERNRQCMEVNWKKISIKCKSDIKLIGILELLELSFIIGSELPGNHGNNGSRTNCMVYIIAHKEECFYSPKF